MDTSIQRNPVYQQLNDRLRSALAAEYQSGDRFLTEREISEKFQVSRATANKALASLVSEGLLEFRRGIGTFVRRDLIDYDLRSLVSFTEKARAAGKKPKTTVLTFRRLEAGTIDCEIREALELDSDERVWELERLRLADGVPVILEHRYVVTSFCPKLTRTQAAGSLYQALTGPHGIEIAGADEVIRAVLLPRKEAALLEVTARAPAFEVTAVGYTKDARPLWWERTLYRGDQYEFHSRLGPVRSATPARGQLRSH
ncbi:GntR family transcriptional regulator [Rubinisphaera margarita]|uniref:GntR family transcriptional regulator n=1 Tax=Rubinisphaera margarita TaxID=2909586 RepID=UPI001EE8C990|nr:GntR family transcriptional regulator [Rubinisphaera margarita]MCG6156540.1 GntR family transcriptional regulator [Rubinisphaera margarita]